MDTPLKHSTNHQNLDFETIQALIDLGKKSFYKGDIDVALDKATQALELLIQVTDPSFYPLLSNNYLLQSRIFFDKKDLPQAINFAERALTISEENSLKSSTIEANLLLGKIKLQAQDNVVAITHLLLAKEKSQQLDEKEFFTQSLLHIGILYNQVYHYSKALEYLNKIEKTYLNHLSTADKTLLFNSLGRAYFRSAEYDTARDYFKKAETTAKQENYKAALVLSLAYLGKVFARKNEFERALRYAKRVNRHRKQIGDVDGIQVNLINLGDIHYQLGKYNEGIKLTSRGIAAAKRMKDGLLEIRGYQIMAEIFRKQKDFKSAVMYQMIYTKFYEDFYQRNDRQKVAEIEHQFVVHQLEQKIQELSKK